ncbi:uncharacterized [Tachysurus ichikawai]
MFRMKTTPETQPTFLISGFLPTLMSSSVQPPLPAHLFLTPVYSFLQQWDWLYRKEPEFIQDRSPGSLLSAVG